MKLRCGSITDQGLNPNRTANEDSYLVRDDLFIVADGLGGEAAGEVASRLSIERFTEYYGAGDAGQKVAERLQALKHLIEMINTFVHAEARKPEFRNMGSTFSLLHFFKGSALVCNVGDSRIYRARGRKLKQLTVAT